MKLLSFILDNLHRLEDSWKSDLENINVWDDLEPLYDDFDDLSGNAILAFVVLAYDNNSSYINLNKDRITDKQKIFKSVIKSNYMEKSDVDEIIFNKNETVNKVIDWYLEQQRDWRWKSVVNCFEYHALTTQMKGNTSDARQMLDIGKCITEGIMRRQEGEKLLEQMQKDFTTVDTALEQENKDKLTKIDFMSHEQWLMTRDQ